MSSTTARTMVDTNVLVYLFDQDAPDKQRVARRLLETLAVEGRLVLSTQVLQELYVVLTRKLQVGLTPEDAEAAVAGFAVFEVAGIDRETVLHAIALSRRHKVSLWDALIVQSALDKGCEVLLTEDLQDGWTVQGVRVENPFLELKAG